MAKLSAGSPLYGASGKIGGVVLRTGKKGTTVSIAPEKKTPKEKRKRRDGLSELKKQNEDGFAVKVNLSRVASKCPEVKTALEKIIKDGQDVYHFLLSDESKTPKVKKILDAAVEKYKWKIN